MTTRDSYTYGVLDVDFSRLKQRIKWHGDSVRPFAFKMGVAFDFITFFKAETSVKETI
ncbi:hypothetical protein [Synechococcus sp. M16CYN]|uniref:hypothetical protein n=1 Tax=Synechococcus sp. M16CYN TaxID=3103139 RepID=UPI0033423322